MRAFGLSGSGFSSDSVCIHVSFLGLSCPLPETWGSTRNNRGDDILFFWRDDIFWRYDVLALGMTLIAVAFANAKTT
jgi:hypothetical protein